MKIQRKSVAAKYFWKRRKDGGFPFDAICAKAQSLVGKTLKWGHIPDPEFEYSPRPPQIEDLLVKSIHKIDMSGDKCDHGQYCYPQVEFICEHVGGKFNGPDLYVDAKKLYETFEDIESDTKNMVGGFHRYLDLSVGRVVRDARDLRESVKAYLGLAAIFKERGWPTAKNFGFNRKEDEQDFKAALQTFKPEVKQEVKQEGDVA